MPTPVRPQYLIWPAYEEGIHRKYGTEHFLVVGASGSGKTTLINILMKSVFATAPTFRAMIYDPKQEVLPYLYALKDSSRVKVLHPFDARCCAWDLAQDIDGPVSARQFATILIPDADGESGSDSFFTNAVRDLMTGVILTLVRCVPNANAWTFRDVILAMLYEPYLRFLMQLERTREGEPFPYVARLRQSYLDGDTRTTGNIRATINSKLSIYEPIAAVWQQAQAQGNTFSLAHWVAESCQDVLVLGNDESSRAAIDAVNQAIFKRATELFLANRESTEVEKGSGQNQTWFFLDEVREAGKLDGFSRLLTKGRSKGACVVMGFQDIDGMKNAYGEEIAQEICGQCNNIAVLKLNSPSTAEWASELFGRRLAASQSKSRGLTAEGGMQMSREAGEDERPWIYTSDLLYLPPTSKINGLTGYFRSPDIDPTAHELRVHLAWEQIAAHLPIPHPDVAEKEAQGRTSGAAAKIMRGVASHYLKPWDEADWERLGLVKFKRTPIKFNADPATIPTISWDSGPGFITT